MRLPKILLMMILSLGAATQASAVTTPLGNIDNADASFGRIVGSGPFSDNWTFSLGGVSDISGLVFDLAIPQLDVLLTGPSINFHTVISGLLNLQSYSFNDLAPGTYNLALAGSGTTFFSGYAASYKVITAVPEADTWLMLIVGAGLIGFQLRRKQKALQMPGLAA